MSSQIYFITGNSTKVLHAQTVMDKFGIKLIQKKLDLIEPRAEDPEVVVIEKALQAFSQIHSPLIVEDSGIFITALNGFPKTFVHFVQETIGIQNILKMMEGVSDRNVEFHQSLAYMETKLTQPKVFSYIDGGYTLADKIWDKSDWPCLEFDRILIPPGEDKPLCMFSPAWGADHDAVKNVDTIHYAQLARWLKEK